MPSKITGLRLRCETCKQPLEKISETYPLLRDRNAPERWYIDLSGFTCCCMAGDPSGDLGPDWRIEPIEAQTRMQTRKPSFEELDSDHTPAQWSEAVKEEQERREKPE